MALGNAAGKQVGTQPVEQVQQGRAAPLAGLAAVTQAFANPCSASSASSGSVSVVSATGEAAGSGVVSTR